ncbi:MAG: ATP-binding protein [Coleofasciculaceae cyanobacterium]
MKLRTKILMGYGVVIALVIFVGGWGVVNIKRLGRASEAILQENYRSIQASEKMIDAMERQDSATLLVMLGRTEEGLEQFRTNQVTFLEWLGRAKDNITISGEKQTLTNLETHYKDYLAAFSQIRELQLTQNQAPVAYYYQTVLPAFELVRESCVELRELNQKTMVTASQETQLISRQAIWSMTAAGFTAAGLGLAFSLILSNRLIRPLQEMSLAAARVSEGNYDLTLNVKSHDELGSLAQEITTMSNKLKAFHHLNVGKVIAEKQRSEAIIRSIGDGLVVVDAEFKIIAINPSAAKILQTDTQQAIGHHFLDITNKQELYQLIKTTAQTGKAPQLDENQSIIASEEESKTHYYKLAITPVTTEEKWVLGVVILLQNVTKLKELDSLKSEFVATASHELRTPLTGMAMSINLLLETAQEKLSEREQELLQAAGEDVERLRALVSDLLDLSKIESGRIEMDFAPIGASLLLERAVSTLKIQAQEKNIELIQQKLDNERGQVKADPNKIIWVLTNLISNALRYTKPGGRIEISAKERSDWVYLSVADNGAGIPLEYQGKIFDKFVQVKTDQTVGGSGLGLTICKEIVHAHGGTIWVESTVGQGTKFTFTLPAVTKQ